MQPSPRNLNKVSLAFLFGVAGLALCVLLLARTSTTQAESPIGHVSNTALFSDASFPSASPPSDALSGSETTASVVDAFRFNGLSTHAQGPTIHYVAPGGDCGGASPCYVSIQAAVDSASDGDTIKVTQGTYTSPGFQVVYINKAITITGGYTTTDWAQSYPLTQPTVIDAENVARRRVVFIDGTNVMTIALAGLTFQRGYAQDSNGGGIYVLNGTVVLRESQVLSNTATGSSPNGVGGGVYVVDGKITLSDNTFRGNTANFFGGGLAIAGGTITLSSNTFQSNSTNTRGGAVYVADGTVTLHGSTFRDNSTRDGGGGILVFGGTITLSSNIFQNNLTNSDHGGGVRVEGGTVLLSNNTFQDNSASDGGGSGVGVLFGGTATLT